MRGPVLFTTLACLVAISLSGCGKGPMDASATPDPQDANFMQEIGDVASTATDLLREKASLEAPAGIEPAQRSHFDLPERTSSRFEEISQRIRENYAAWEFHRAEMARSPALPRPSPKKAPESAPRPPETYRQNCEHVSAIQQKYSVDWLNASLRVEVLKRRTESATGADKLTLVQRLEEANAALAAVEADRDAEIREHVCRISDGPEPPQTEPKREQTTEYSQMPGIPE